VKVLKVLIKWVLLLTLTLTLTLPIAALSGDISGDGSADDSVDDFTDKTSLIEWFVTDFPPFTIVTGPQKDQGYGDVLYSRLKSKLGNYRHQRHIVTQGHGQNAIKHHKNACAHDLLKNEKRSKYMIFSKPLYRLLPIGALSLARNDISPLLNQSGHFELSRLVDNQQLGLGVVTKRSYGQMIDRQLDELAKTNANITRTGAGMSVSLYNMLKLNRIDVILGYALEMNYMATTTITISTKPKKQLKVTYSPISNQPSLLTGHVGCHRGAFGQQVIDTINARIDRADDAMISKSYQQWLPKDAQTLYLSLLEGL
jgi:uncharacterized protein (TIGR02285 family)